MFLNFLCTSWPLRYSIDFLQDCVVTVDAKPLFSHWHLDYQLLCSALLPPREVVPRSQSKKKQIKLVISKLDKYYSQFSEGGRSANPCVHVTADTNKRVKLQTKILPCRIPKFTLSNWLFFYNHSLCISGSTRGASTDLYRYRYMPVTYRLDRKLPLISRNLRLVKQFPISYCRYVDRTEYDYDFIVSPGTWSETNILSQGLGLEASRTPFQDLTSPPGVVHLPTLDSLDFRYGLNFIFFKHISWLNINAQTMLGLRLQLKKSLAFWPLEYKLDEIAYAQHKQTVSEQRTKLQFKSLAPNPQHSATPMWYFFQGFAPVESFYSKAYDFHSNVIKIYWKSRDVFKQFYGYKRRWTARKFFHKFSAWYRQNKKEKCVLNTFLWELLVRSGFVLSKYEANISFAYHLVYSEVTLTEQTRLPELRGCIINVSQGFVRTLRLRRLKKHAMFSKIAAFKHKQLINRLTQWRDVAKNKPKYIRTVLLANEPYSTCWLFDALSCSLHIVSNTLHHQLLMNNSGLLYNSRHNLEKLNLYKLKV